MSTDEFIKQCKKLISDYTVNHYESSQDLCMPEVNVVWQSKTLQNHKAMLCTSYNNYNAYFECTYSGDKDELYLDVYKKIDNIKYNFI